MASLSPHRLQQYPHFFKDEACEELDAYNQWLFEQTGERNSEHSCWQYFCVLPDIKSVGGMGDERTYARPVILRAVESSDALGSSSRGERKCAAW